jgi:hypothetical protein
VKLGYHLSVWGTGEDIVYSDPSNARVDQLATSAANFYTSLQANFDLVFAEFSDRDAGFKQYVYGDGGAAWWNEADFGRNVRFLSKFVSLAQKRVVMWQIPMGNTKMRAMNNTWNHYQDNRVEWLLDDPAGTHLRSYMDAGVIAFLFGRGADGATCTCDANGDGMTNPAPINGNTLWSLNGDDDGGFFKDKGAAYYASGPMSLTADTGSTPPTATNTPVPTATATNTPVPAATATRTPLPAATATRTATPLPTATRTPLPAATATRTPLPTATATRTPVPTATRTPVPTATRTPLPTATRTPLPTATRTPLPTATNTPQAAACPDVTGDGVVNLSDQMAVMVGRFYPYNPTLDVNRDGVINGTDYTIVQQNQGRVC